MSKKLDKSLMDAYLSVYEDKRGHAAGSSDAEKQASQLASDVRYKAKGKVPEGASKEEKRKIFLQILNASPAPAVVKQMAKEKLLGEQYLPEEEYDRYRDEKLMRGGDHRSKETKERSYSRSEDDDKRKGDTPMQKEFKKKYGKKATALDAVKQDIMKKYGKGAIMKTKKKKKVDEAYKSGKEVSRRNSDDIKKFMQMGKDAPKNEKLNKARGEGPDAYRKAKLDSGTKAGKSNLLKGIEKTKRPIGSGISSGAAARVAGGVGAGLVAANALKRVFNKEEFVSEDDMKGMSVKSGHKRPTKSGAGMTAKGVAAYRRRNPGSKLQTAVTGKVKKGSKDAKRRKSYCARSAGQMKKFPKAAKDPNSRLRQARRRWKC